MKNTFKPAFTVDITNCYDEDDVARAIADAKLNNSLTEYSKNAFVEMCVDKSVDAIINLLFGNNNTVYFDGETFTLFDIELVDEEEEKPNIFKRFWNWITRKK